MDIFSYLCLVKVIISYKIESCYLDNYSLFFGGDDKLTSIKSIIIEGWKRYKNKSK